MTAELVGYDYRTKSVIFKKEDGVTYQYPLIKLDTGGKVKAATSPEVSKTSAQWDISFGKVTGIALLSLTVFLLILIVLDIGSLWGAAALVAGVPEFSKSLKLWGKFLLIQIAFIVLGGIVGGIFGAFAGNPEDAAQVGSFAGGILGVIRLIVSFLIIPGHFDIGFFRAMAFVLVYPLLLGVGLVIAGGGIVLLMMIDPIGEAVVVHAWLRPFGLV